MFFFLSLSHPVFLTLSIFRSKTNTIDRIENKKQLLRTVICMWWMYAGSVGHREYYVNAIGPLPFVLRLFTFNILLALFFVCNLWQQNLDKLKAMHKQSNKHTQNELNEERILHERPQLITLITLHTITIIYSILFLSFCLLLASTRKMNSRRLSPEWWMLFQKKNTKLPTLPPLFLTATTKV